MIEILLTDTVDEGRIKINEGFALVEDRFAPFDGSGVSLLSFIDEAEHAGIENGTSTFNVTPALNLAGATGGVVFVPKGTYIINENVQAIFETAGFELLCHPGAQFLLQDGGPSNPFLIYTTSNIVLDRVVLIEQRTVKSGAGITAINSSQVTIRNCTVDGFVLYGIAVHDDNTSVATSYTASTISYSGNVISDSASGLSVFNGATKIGISGSLYNNHVLTVVSVTAGAITVEEDLVAEAAGLTRVYAESNTITFTPLTRRISATTPIFGNFREGDRVAITGAASAGNNQTVTIESMDIDNDGFTVLEDIETEAPFNTVTFTKVGNSRLQLMVMEACDDLTIEKCRVLNIGQIGIEVFPKVTSRNLVVRDNVVYECGKRVTGGCGIKASQGYINARVTDNTVVHSQIGLIVSSWDATEIANNTILNCDKHGIAIGISHHMRYDEAPFNVLMVHDNLIAYVEDFVTGEQFTSVYQYPAINIGGLSTTTGLVDVANNDIFNYPAGIHTQYILRSHPNVRFRGNVLVDSGASLLIPVIGTCNTSSGSATISNLKIGGSASVGGLGIGCEFHAVGIPPGTFIQNLDAAAKTGTLCAADGITPVNATANGSDVAFYSAYLDGADLSDNTWVNTDIQGDQILTITATSGTYTLTGNGATTAGIAEDAAAATVQTAIRGLGGDYADAVVSGSAGGPYTIVADAVSPLVTDSAGLSGGAATAVITRPDAANLTVQIYSTNGRILNNRLYGMGAYALIVGGDGSMIRNNTLSNPNPSLIANRGVIQLVTAGTYHVHNNFADVSQSPKALVFMVNNTNATDVHISNTFASEEWVRPLLNPTPVAANGVFGQFGKNRMTYGTVPTDLTKNRYVGDIKLNTAASPLNALVGWIETTTGSAGQTWQGFGSVTFGATGDKPTPAAFSKGMFFYDTTLSQLELWDGTAWIVIA